MNTEFTKKRPCECGCKEMVPHKDVWGHRPRFIIGHNLRRALHVRFWEKVRKTSTCWLWVGSKNKWGYGSISNGHKSLKAHRVALELLGEKIPRGMCVLHRCDTRACVNPNHLSIGTTQDNINDRNAKGRQARGASSGRSRLSESDVIKMRELHSNNGARPCELGKMFGVTQQQAGRVIRGASWSHIS